MDSHPQCALVDRNLCTLDWGKLCRNVPNACKMYQDDRDAEGDLGREEMRDASEVVSKEGDDDEREDIGGGTGMGVSVTSVVGSTGSEVTISQYLSWSKGDIDRKIGEKMGSNVSAGRRVMYEWKPCRWRVFRVRRVKSPVRRSKA